MRGGKDGGGEGGAANTTDCLGERSQALLQQCAVQNTHHKYVLLHHKGHWGEGVEEAGGGGGGGGGRHMQVHEGLQDGH